MTWHPSLALLGLSGFLRASALLASLAATLGGLSGFLLAFFGLSALLASSLGALHLFLLVIIGSFIIFTSFVGLAAHWCLVIILSTLGGHLFIATSLGEGNSSSDCENSEESH